jgi:transcriptional regulator with XRE-family HTH domain
MIDTFNANLGIRIKELRDKIGLSQAKLADLLGLNRASLSQIENGERKLTAEEINKLAKIFNISCDVLLNPKRDVQVVLEKKAKYTTTVKESIRISVPQRNVAKFKEVLLYILNKVGSKPNIGETVIYKLLYFIDFNYYEKYEEQLIGATYIKNNYGPTPMEFREIVSKMKGKDLVEVSDKYFHYPQTKYLPLREADLSGFKANEKEIIDDVINKLSGMNASQISEYSHQDVPWVTTDDGGRINYESVFYRAPQYSVCEYNDKL